MQIQGIRPRVPGRMGIPVQSVRKSQSVNFVALECPGDAITGVNPNFIRKKRESLLCHIVTLTADSGVPGLLGLDVSLDTEKHQNEQHEENP